MNKTIAMRSDEVSTFSSYRIPVPFEQLYDHIFISARSAFIKRRIKRKWSGLNCLKEGKKQYRPFQHLANAIAGIERLEEIEKSDKPIPHVYK